MNFEIETDVKLFNYTEIVFHSNFSVGHVCSLGSDTLKKISVLCLRKMWPSSLNSDNHFTATRHAPPGGGGCTPLCGLNGDVRPDRVWFSRCFVFNGVSISSLSVLNRVSLHDLMA